MLILAAGMTACTGRHGTIVLRGALILIDSAVPESKIRRNRTCVSGKAREIAIRSMPKPIHAE
jgi:hypothetical protein